MTDFFDSDLDSDFDTDEARDAFLAQAFEELASLPPEPYRVKQQRVYRRCMKQGDTAAALDALWRAASEGDLLLPHEVSDEQFTPERIDELLFMLEWR